MVAWSVEARDMLLARATKVLGLLVRLQARAPLMVPPCEIVVEAIEAFASQMRRM